MCGLRIAIGHEGFSVPNPIFSDLAEDDDHLSRGADRRMRMQNEDDPEMMSFFKGEIREKCRSKSRELHRLCGLFFEVYHERKWGD